MLAHIEVTQDEGKQALLKIDALMVERGMTVLKLAKKAGIAYNTALAYQRDSSDRLSKTVLVKIARALEVDVPDLFISSQNKSS